MESVDLDTDFKQNILNSFMAANKNLIKIKLSNCKITNLNIISQIFINHKLDTFKFTHFNIDQEPLMLDTMPNPFENMSSKKDDSQTNLADDLDFFMMDHGFYDE